MSDSPRRLVHRLGRPVRLDTALTGPLLLLVVCFLPGAVLSSGDGYGPTKLATMAFVLLPMFFLGRDRRARERAGETLGRQPDDTSSG